MKPTTAVRRFSSPAWPPLALLLLPFASAAAPPEAAPPPPAVVLEDFMLAGDLGSNRAAFTLTATARVDARAGGTLDLLNGTVALTELGPHPKWQVRAGQNRFALVFDHAGRFPLKLRFDAAVRQTDDWNSVEFRVAPSALQPIVLRGLAAETQFEFAGAARPRRQGNDFLSYLPSEGTVKLAWKEARRETEGKLFYAAEMLSQITVGPGLMRQTALLDFKVMQGELKRAALLLRGAGEVTRVQGDQVLAWRVEPTSGPTDRRLLVEPASAPADRRLLVEPASTPADRRSIVEPPSGPTDRRLIVEPPSGPTDRRSIAEPASGPAERRLVVEFNQPQKDAFALQIQVQTPLAAFPQTVQAVELTPEAATRVSGYFRILNQGAVRLEIPHPRGLSQVSPEQFPETAATRAFLPPSGNQRFVYRFSGAGFGLRIQADQILPELSVSQLLAYHLGESELAIDAELELDIREAPLRELVLRVPKGYAIAQLTAPGLSDYFLRETADQPQAELRLVYGQPISDRQVAQLRLERNKPLEGALWELPRLDVPKAKSVRGHVAVAADPGYRLTPERTQGLTEIATAFFPAKVPGIQAAFRVSDAAWQASLRVERLPQTVQADVFHLFSIGEGIAYGSSLINYVVSGAPVASFKVAVSEEYTNVEFTGKDIRSWQQTPGGYVVQLHSPVAGTYTLLATCERPFKAQGETLTFTGARPLDAQSEQGYTLIVSAYQFDVKPALVSRGLLRLDTREVPPEYRLFFDAPILAAFRYTSRPFDLKLALSPLAQADSLSLMVDRATLTNRISKEGQILTDARYYVKNRGNPNLRLALPPGNELWSASVNGAPVVPVLDASGELLPLPPRAGPDETLVIDLKLAAKSNAPGRVRVCAPVIGAPVLLMAWRVEPDTGQRLVYRGGSLSPAGGAGDPTGFGALARLFAENPSGAWGGLLGTIGLLAATLIAWRWASGRGAYRFRHLGGAVIGLAALALATATFLNLLDLASQQYQSLPKDLSFMAPVQQKDSALTVDVGNVADRITAGEVLGHAWPALAAVVLWIYAWLAPQPGRKALAQIGGWLLVAWAALRLPNGATAFLAVLALFLVVHSLLPAVWRLFQFRPQPRPATAAAPPVGPAPATALLLLAACLCLDRAGAAGAIEGRYAPPMVRAAEAAIPEFVGHEIRVEEGFITEKAEISWKAEKGELLPVLFEPAVLVELQYPTNALEIRTYPHELQYTTDALESGQYAHGSKVTHALVARRGGTFAIEVKCQMQTLRRGVESGVVLPVPYGLVNRLKLTVVNADVDVIAPQAVAIEREAVSSNTVATVVLAPASEAWIGWRPRSRDLKGEKPVFYAEVTHLLVPMAGVIEGAQYVSIRPAQGELRELVLGVPAGATVTDVLDPAHAQAGTPAGGSIVSLWRFDPDARKLRVTLAPGQSRPFALLVRTQSAAGPLPLDYSCGLLSVENAGGQIGLVGVATGNEVQLDSAVAAGCSPINLEDFPPEPGAALQAELAGLTVRRAFRYEGDPAALAGLKVQLRASAVDPDIRVETQDTVSLGEDRTVLAETATVEITRAGIFRLSFMMPPGFDVESISGAALSHWTESKGVEGRVITLHLAGKTEGRQALAISLAGPGVKAGAGWQVPRLALREAGKQRGSLLLAPEQGFRLQAGASEGLTQLDPQRSGIREKGVLAFRVLQASWSLGLAIERVDPWVQVTSLEQATVSDALVKVVANLQYQIEYAGVKSFRVYLPTNAENAHFQGEQVADFVRAAGPSTNGLQAWEVKLHRRVTGPYLLQATYQTLVPEQTAEVVLRGVQAAEVNLQRGFVTVQSGGRLQVRVETVPPALQPTEWQSIPRVLQQDLPAAAANFSYRLVEPSFELALKLERREAAKLLEAHVNRVTFTSILSDEGILLTQARIELQPGDKRLLEVTLPPEAHFWFAFVNQAAVWPWRGPRGLLIPLDPQPRGDPAVPVEVYFTSRAGAPGRRSLDLKLLAPKFDLPLENIAWQVSLGEKWRFKGSSGSFQFEREEPAGPAASADLAGYLQTEAAGRLERIHRAEDLVAAGNSALDAGNPQQARRAFQAAYGLSSHDAAFNEDARVQLHNIKLQQALVGLNVCQAATAGQAGELGARFRDLARRNEVNYTQQDAKAIIDRNTADDNAAFMRLAERLIQQQDAAAGAPAALRATLPEQGRLLTFKRAVAVDPGADLSLRLSAVSAGQAPGWMRGLILAATLGVMGAFGGNFAGKYEV